MRILGKAHDVAPKREQVRKNVAEIGEAFAAKMNMGGRSRVAKFGAEIAQQLAESGEFASEKVGEGYWVVALQQEV